jgi:hypothetical protein
MKKHIQNMERLWLKMQARYGESDDLVQRFRQDLSALQEKNAKKRASKGVGLRQADKPSVGPSVH